MIEMLQTAIEAARKAGRVLAEMYPASHHVTIKGYRDIVTEADTRAEEIVLEVIRARFPEHAILSEEAGASAGSGYTWVVDPLDGTTNYAHHVPTFAVSIGVLKGGEPLLGVIYDPLHKQMFTAERGGGARLNGAPARVSRTADFGYTVLGFDWGHGDAERARTLAWLQELAPRCGTVRALGSAALGLAYVAAGRLDAYFNPASKPWDVAAGMLLVAEAGGRCTTLTREPYRVDAPGCLATNGLIHEEFPFISSPV